MARVGLITLLAAAAQLAFAAGPAADPAPRAGAFATDSPRPVAIGVRVNGAPAGDWVLMNVQGQWHANREAWQAWRLRPPADLTPVQYQDQAWYPLNAWPGFSARVQDAGQALELDFAPEAFEASRLGATGEQAPATAARATALFLNYDSTATFEHRQVLGSSRDLGLLAEAGWTGPSGFFTSSFGVDASPQGTRAQRLETSFTHDEPGNLLTWRVGDSSTRAAAWSQPAYFGGLQWGRNFDLNPGFISRPIPLFNGSASSPSTLQLFVNDVLRQSSEVPAGPFSLQGATGLSPGGQARLVLRDAAGRETVVVSDFFSSPKLLEAGLTDWSAEVGALRKGLGSDPSHYGELFAAGLWRRGLSATRTVETRAELGPGRQAAGLGMATTFRGYWLAQGAVALSHGDAGTGWRGLLQLEADPVHQRLALRLQASGRAFRDLGQPADRRPARVEASLSLGLLSDRWQSLRLFAGRIASFDNPGSRTLGLAYSRSWKNGYFSLSATQARAPGRAAHSVVATLTFWLDRINFSASATRQAGHLDSSLGASRSPFTPGELGWRVASGHRQQQPYAEAGVYGQTSRAWLSADLSAAGQEQALRLGARGALAFMDGSLFATQRLDDSFALVQVPGFPNVHVSAQGRALGVTDAKGQALVPSLYAFRPGYVRLDGNDLPIAADIENLEQKVTPSRRSAVRLMFAQRPGRSALLNVVLDDGEPAPLGASVELEGGAEPFMVGHRGAAFVTGLQDEGNRLVLRWKGASCRLDIALPPRQDEDITRVGPLGCKGVAR